MDGTTHNAQRNAANFLLQRGGEVPIPPQHSSTHLRLRLGFALLLSTWVTRKSSRDMRQAASIPSTWATSMTNAIELCPRSVEAKSLLSQQAACFAVRQRSDVRCRASHRYLLLMGPNGRHLCLVLPVLGPSASQLSSHLDMACKPTATKIDNVYLHGYDDGTDELLEAMPEISETEAALLYDLLSKVFVYDPLHRISAEEMLAIHAA
ncbi:hypothetical protein F53441_13479 [Fusarium austroafricanum]|uniref:Uncharacterized protein n=1 Tax=Fusarium austroafricanum TaxID=2364996 RepID=A0A8H4NJP1_9HYPO|nr:hypothetical protein F53441_13479 [Fusarium austroafricanum]